VQRIHVLTRAALQKLPLREAIRASDQLVSAVQAGLTASQEITSLGLEVLGLSILAVKPTPDTARWHSRNTRRRAADAAGEYGSTSRARAWLSRSRSGRRLRWGAGRN